MRICENRDRMVNMVRDYNYELNRYRNLSSEILNFMRFKFLYKLVFTLVSKKEIYNPHKFKSVYKNITLFILWVEF
jgi:hypothetical protein